MQATATLSMDNLVDNFNYAMLLHGEQYFKLCTPKLPSNGTLKTVAKPLQVLDKNGRAALVVGGFETYDTKTKKLIAYNEGSFFIRGAHVPQKKQITDGDRAKFAIQRLSLIHI